MMKKSQKISRGWENSHLVTDKTRGFIYLIINEKENKLYIGKKKTISERRISVAGRKNKKRVVTPSNWKTYYGSSDALKKDVLRLGKDSFRRVILGAYEELHSVNYGEAELQFIMKVLDEKNKYEWYNGNINIKAMRPPSDRQYVDRLNKILEQL
jgi:hypothetical protein